MSIVPFSENPKRRNNPQPRGRKNKAQRREVAELKAMVLSELVSDPRGQKRARRAPRNPRPNKKARFQGPGRGAQANGFIGPLRTGFPRNQLRSLAGRGSTRNGTTNRQSMIIEEDEYIGEVTGAATAANFGNTAYPVNIGQAGTFPWGSGVVKNNFEKYEFDFLEFYYKREVSEFATNGTTGKVMLSFDTDASDGPPTTKQMVEDTDPHVDGMPCENLVLVIPPSMLKLRNDAHFIRPAGLPGASDIKTFDIGTLNVSTQGFAGNSAVVGELHVRYRCRVFIPILEAAIGAPANNSVAWFQSTAVESLTTTVAKTLALAVSKVNGLSAVNTAGSIVLPVGNYLIDFSGQFRDSAAEAEAFVLEVLKNGSAVSTTDDRPVFQTTGATTTVAIATIGSSAYVTSNGTDAFTLQATATGAAGTLTVGGSMRIVAI